MGLGCAVAVGGPDDAVPENALLEVTTLHGVATDATYSS
jgi:hypothetical protein